jgi:hypothetical protein
MSKKPKTKKPKTECQDSCAGKAITAQDYKQLFRGGRKRKTLLLEYALDIRKFEISMYWTRASYFWTFIGAAFAGYGAVQTLTGPERASLSVYICSVGIVFSFGWYCVNRGSKQWQENWENHVDLLKDTVAGPLYKVVLTRHDDRLPSRFKRWVVGPAPFSVSKVNQITSLYVCLLWVILAIHAIPDSATEFREHV